MKRKERKFNFKAKEIKILSQLFAYLIFIIVVFNGCMTSHKLLGITGGSGDIVTISDIEFNKLWGISIDVLTEAGISIIAKNSQSKPAVIEGVGKGVGNVKLEILSLSSTSHRLTIWTSAGFLKDAEERSFNQHILKEIQIRK